MAVSLQIISRLTLVLLVGQVFCRELQRDGNIKEFVIPSGEEVDIRSDVITDGRRDNDRDIIVDPNVQARFIAMLRVTNGGPWGQWGPAQFCKNGSFGVGYDMKIEPRQRVDNTALNAIKLICVDKNGNVTGGVTSTEGPWGSWVGPVRCQKHDHLTIFDLQVQKPQGKWKDDTAANYVKFKCRYSQGRSYDLVKPPGHGLWGTWGPWSNSCPTRSAICGIQTKVESPQGKFKDDTALNDVRFFCCKL